jgi:hypothetical protein
MKLSIILTLAISAATALAVAPNFTATTPAGGQRGTEVEVRLTGDRLTDAQEIFFYDKGIECVKILQATNGYVRALFNIAPDCRIGEHNLRVRTAGGISALRIFFVGPFPNVEEIDTAKEPNNELKTSQKIALNNTINGNFGSEDVDYYSVEVKKGQRLSAEIEGARLGRTMLDSYLAIRDEQGRMLAESDDTALLAQDAFLSIIAPEDGKYFIESRDSSYSGSGQVYRLHVGTFPRPMAVYPMGGKLGDTIEGKFIGDPKGDFTQKVKLPSAPSAKFGAVAEREGLAPSANWMRVSSFPNVLEAEPNDTTTNATVVTAALPLAFNGILSKRGDVDHFKFTAKKDQNLDVQLWGRRLGSAIDSTIAVLNAKGSQIAAADDSGGSPDSATRVRIPADGEYYLRVTDHQGRGGPGFAYRVEIQEVTPLVTITIPDTARYDYETRKSIVVPRGNRLALQMNVARESFSGALDLKFDGLPKGMKVYGDAISNGVSSQVLVFEAASDAPIDGNILTPVARPMDAEKNTDSLFRHRVEWVRIQNATVYTQSDVYQIAAAVTEAVPFKINIVEPKVPIVQGGSLDLKVQAERQEGFTNAITVKMVWNPSGLSSLPDMMIPAGSNSVIYRVNATTGAELRSWKIAMVASATVNGGSAYVSSQLMPIEVSKPFVDGKMDLTSVERGKTAKIVCKLEQKASFDGKATMKLVGLPAGASAKDVVITKESTEAVFDVETTEKANPGMTRNLFCSVEVVKHGEPIMHNIARGGILRVDVPRVKIAANDQPVKK